MDFPAMRVALRVQISRALKAAENGMGVECRLSEVYALIAFGETSGLIPPSVAAGLKAKAQMYEQPCVEDTAPSVEDFDTNVFSALKSANECILKEREENLKDFNWCLNALEGLYQYIKLLRVKKLDCSEAIEMERRFKRRISNAIVQMFNEGLISAEERMQLATKYYNLCKKYT